MHRHYSVKNVGKTMSLKKLPKLEDELTINRTNTYESNVLHNNVTYWNDDQYKRDEQRQRKERVWPRRLVWAFWRNGCVQGGGLEHARAKLDMLYL